MLPRQQRVAFELTLRRLLSLENGLKWRGRTLAALGDSFCCYVPRLLRDLDFDHLATLSYQELTKYYEAGSWAIDDVIRLLERIADDAGIAVSPRSTPANDGVSPKSESAGSARANHREKGATPTAASLDDDKLGCVELPHSTSDVETHLDFESMREVLKSHSTHPLLDVDVRELLEPADTKIPTKFLGSSVRRVLETPLSRLAGSWIGREHLDCLLTMLRRAVTSIRSTPEALEEGVAVSEVSSQADRHAAPRDIHVDGQVWRTWCEAIHAARLQTLKLGTVAERLRDLPAGLWDQPLSKFTATPLSGLAVLEGVGPARIDVVVATVRSLATELTELPRISFRLKFIPGPLRGVQEWIEQVLESRRVPEVDELTIQLLRPLAWQLRHDLDEREAQIAVHRLRLDESATRSTLEELAAFHGVTRERIRQLEQWGPRVLQVRLPQGRYLLDALYGHLSHLPTAGPPSAFVHRLAVRCFESETTPPTTADEVAVAWDEAGEDKLTPMTKDQILEWSRTRLPRFVPADVFEYIRSRAPCLQDEGQPGLWFTRSIIDRILYALCQQPGPAQLADLAVLVDSDTGSSPPTSEWTASHADRAMDASAEYMRSLWGRIRRDPRFVECGDHQLLLPSHKCGLQRFDGAWMIHLRKVDSAGDRLISVSVLAQIIADGLSARGIVDATTWGVHRFAREAVVEMFRASFQEAVGPHVLADILVKLSGGIFRAMRRRRLRWDESTLAIPVRGKRGWIGHVVSQCGYPMLLSELVAGLRGYYQDYPDYIAGQITTLTDEDGELDGQAQFVTGLGHRIPTIVLPTEWRFDAGRDDVSKGVLQIAQRLARQVGSDRLCLDELKSADWLRTLVERQVSALRIGLCVACTDDATSPAPDAGAVADMHSSTDRSRVLSADLDQPFVDLLAYVFSRVLACAPEHRPWSLAELRASAEDIEWLKALFERATASDLRLALAEGSRFHGYTGEAQLGAALLLLESELARRHASEGMLWSAIHHQVKWTADASRYLFTHRQPNSRHKACLETAAKELDLRCAFGEDTAQEWYQSVFLQCGFSKTSFESRLPEWLGGQGAPVSVARLLGSDRRYSSSTFAELWRALRDYRHGSLERSGLKDVLEESPWVLGEWHDSLIHLCRSDNSVATVVNSQTGSLTPGGQRLASADLGEPSSDRRFVSDPRVRWSSVGLKFVCSVELTEALEIEDDADIVIDGEVRARLVVQPDGSYAATPSEIEISHASSTLIAELRSVAGTTLAVQTLSLWDDDDDVAGFVIKSGRRIDPWSREFALRETLLIYSADLRIEPTRPPEAICGNGARIAVRLLPLESKTTRLFLGTEVLWEANAPSDPSWREGVQPTVELRPRESPKQFRVSVMSPSGVTATAIRLRRVLFDLSRDGNSRSYTEWMPLDPEIRNAGAIGLTVLLRKGNESSELRRRMPLVLPGHLWRTESQWEAVPSRAHLELQQVRNAEFKLSPPDSEIPGERWQIFEGRRWIDTVKKHPQRITAVEGWGAPLVLRSAPYNCCQIEQPLLQALTDQGEISDVSSCADNAVTIAFRRRISPDNSHTVVLLDDCGMTEIIEGEELAGLLVVDPSSAMWTFSLPRHCSERQLVALAVAYNGERLGSWWRPDWTKILRRPAELAGDRVAQWASEIANSLRWFHLPLLNQLEAFRVREFTKEFAAPILSTWLGRAVSPLLIHDAVGNGWMCVVRALFGEWTPNAEEAGELDKSLEPAAAESTMLPLTTATLALTEVSSLLALRFIRSRMQSVVFKSAKSQERRALIASLRMRVLGRDSIDDLIERVAQDVSRTDEPPEGTIDFVRDGLIEKVLILLDQSESPQVTELDRSNIEVAMRLDAFRRLGVVAGLERLTKDLL